MTLRDGEAKGDEKTDPGTSDANEGQSGTLREREAKRDKGRQGETNQYNWDKQEHNTV